MNIEPGQSAILCYALRVRAVVSLIQDDVPMCIVDVCEQMAVRPEDVVDAYQRRMRARR